MTDNIPVKENEELELEVMGFGKNGDPILKYEGYTIFLKADDRTFLVGDSVRIKIKRALERFAFSELA